MREKIKTVLKKRVRKKMPEKSAKEHTLEKKFHSPKKHTKKIFPLSVKKQKKNIQEKNC